MYSLSPTMKVLTIVTPKISLSFRVCEESFWEAHQFFSVVGLLMGSDKENGGFCVGKCGSQS